ncbi:hypothetical protein AVEN_255030-1 [Araneus ventricosus]|uniref:Mos1 transposase HTH domain-containing protein n=1 Tax=Araneus ventricosus TaxID=182803 RepID=A0A4Y2LX28_ARAVE|nr:hypothetical protein AVEN_255030-1 [Araneus ventricosus]
MLWNGPTVNVQLDGRATVRLYQERFPMRRTRHLTTFATLHQSLWESDIHRQICEVYGATVMCEGKVRKWVRDFKAGRDNVHDDSLSGSPSMITDDMVASVEAKILENRRFTP